MSTSTVQVCTLSDLPERKSTEAVPLYRDSITILSKRQRVKQRFKIPRFESLNVPKWRKSNIAGVPRAKSGISLRSSSGEKKSEPQEEDRLAWRYDRTDRGHTPAILAIRPGHFLAKALDPIMFEVMDFLIEAAIDLAAVDLVMRDDVPTIQITGALKPSNFDKDIVPNLRDMLDNRIVSETGCVGNEYEIMFMTGSIERETTAPADHYRKAGLPGQSVGVQGIGWSTGTIGGYMLPKNPELLGQCFALSCHHVLLPTNKSASSEEAKGVQVPFYLKVVQKYHKGVSWKLPSEVIVESPSLGDHQATLERSEAAESEAKDALAELKEKEVFGSQTTRKSKSFWKIILDNLQQTSKRLQVFDRKFGTVIATSGYRVHPTMGVSLDWGIIRVVNSRAGKNIMKPANKGTWMFWDAFANREIMITDIADPAFGEEVYKVGRSGESYGVINGITDGVNLPGNGRLTREWTIIGNAKKEFSLPGDSGSFIINRHLQLVGMIIGGRDELSYFTPIKIILQDIEQQTGKRFSL
ncbi:hypothetical protein TWF694_009363 [Orbilia ellipsospora]|uniref:Uncharacterized protein n=1 Tax=Orbilia ellipsospora TaxID=2528407 RepID=A0AAV9XEQ7_9PEZI